MTGVMGSWFAWVFLFGEVVITLSAWQSHCSRFFPVKRTRCTVDDLVRPALPPSLPPSLSIASLFVSRVQKAKPLTLPRSLAPSLPPSIGQG